MNPFILLYYVMKLTFFVTNSIPNKKKHALQSEVRTSLPLQNMPLYP